MLKGRRPIKPEDIKEQIPWAELEGVVVLGLMPEGKVNKLFMSSLSVEQLCQLKCQLEAHLVHLLVTEKGALDESF